MRFAFPPYSPLKKRRETGDGGPENKNPPSPVFRPRSFFFVISLLLKPGYRLL
jgi:hypothetical protein